MRKIEIEPRVLRRSTAELYVGSPDLLERMVQVGELKPLPSKGKLCLFDRRDIDAATDRMKIHGLKETTVR